MKLPFCAISFFACLVAVKAAGTTTPDPIVAAIDGVPSYRIYSIAQHESSFTGSCVAIRATICRTIHRFANDPGAAAREVDMAMHAACDAGHGVYDTATDRDTIVALGVLTSQGDHGTVHSCRTGNRLSGAGVYVEDYGAAVDRQSHDAITRLLGDKRSRYEALTTVVGYTADGFLIRQAMVAGVRTQNCLEVERAALREGAVTTAGLLVEMRARVALVQPERGPATWVPIDQLKLAGTRPVCSGAAVTP